MKKACLIGLMMCLLSASAHAQEMYQYPVAYVSVNADSHLNVRATPDGELLAVTLNPLEDVVILAERDGWALVIRAKHVGNTDMNGKPLGWCSMEFLRTYRWWLSHKKIDLRGSTGLSEGFTGAGTPDEHGIKNAYIILHIGGECNEDLP